jgi:hypothetical protein
LAEYKADYKGKTIVKDGFPVMVAPVNDGVSARIFCIFDDFMDIGKDFEAERMSLSV